MEESEELAIVREAGRLYVDGDIEGALGMVHPQGEFVLPDPIAPEGRTYRGLEGFRAGILRWIGDWDGYAPRIDRYIDADPGHVLVLLTERGTHRETGEDRMRKSSVLCVLEAGQMIRCCVFETWQDGFEQAGLDSQHAAEDASRTRAEEAGRPDGGLWPGTS